MGPAASCDFQFRMTASDAHDLFTRLSHALAGQYVLLRALGHGGMGSVFLARDVKLERPVAIKVIAPGAETSPDTRDRFAQEARTIARLRHPNIVAVHAAGEADGLLYFVLEYVPGESLRERLTRDRILSLPDALPILRDIALALDYAHAAGIVHRDVKPENVLLDGETGRAMLTDFGVARVLSDPSNLTGSGFVLGSPRYMSPEQASGDSALDGRSDLYSLGLIAYEVFSGQPAIDAPTAAQILVKQITEPLEPLSTHRQFVPSDIGAAVDRLLHKLPAERFQRGAAFAAALAGEEFDDRTPPHQVGRVTPGTRPVVRRAGPAGWAWSAAAVFTAAIGLFAWTRSQNPATSDRAWFVAPFEVQGPDRSLDWLREGSLNMLTLSLSQWTDLRVVEYERTLDLLHAAQLDAQPRVGLEDARKLARRAGAGRVVMGQVASMGDSLVVTAALFDVRTGQSKNKARVAAPLGADPRVIFESIATDLLDLVGAPRITFELAKQTTSSVTAYRHYLEGLRHLNRWRLRLADSAFSRALSADSTFALAHYKRSLALGWANSADSARRITAEKAVQFADRLPPRLQEIVRGHLELTQAFVAMQLGDTAATKNGFLASRNRLARLVALDSADAEAWYALADADFHLVLNTSYGFSPDSLGKYLTESMQGFQRTIRIDSTFHLAYQHLVEMYGLAANSGSLVVIAGDTVKPAGSAMYERRIGTPEQLARLRADAQTRAREAAGGWVASDPDAINARSALANMFEQMAHPDSAIQTLREALKRPTTADPLFEWRIPIIKAKAGMPSAGPELRTVMRRFTADSLRVLNVVDRLQGLLGAMTVGGQTGMPSLVDSAASMIARTDPVLPGSEELSTADIAEWLTSGMRVGMGLPMSAALRSRLVAGIQAIERGPGEGRRDTSVPYMLYLETRDAVFADVARRWSSSPSNGYPELQALMAIRRGDTVTAERLASEFPSVDSLARASLGMTGLRTIARATVIAELGDARRAVQLYETIDPRRFGQSGSPETTWPMYVRSYLARGHILEQLGERPRAIAAYEKFLSLWKDAEAPLQPQLREAREALARLHDAGGVAIRATVP